MVPLPPWQGKKYSSSGCGEFIISVSLLSSTLVFPMFPSWLNFKCKSSHSFPPSNFLTPPFFFCMKRQSLDACYMPRAVLSPLCNCIFISWPSEVVAIYCWGFWQLSNLLKVKMYLVVEWNPTMQYVLIFFCKNLQSLIYLKVEIAQLQESYHNQTWIYNYKVHVVLFVLFCKAESTLFCCIVSKIWW